MSAGTDDIDWQAMKRETIFISSEEFDHILEMAERPAKENEELRRLLRKRSDEFKDFIGEDTE